MAEAPAQTGSLAPFLIIGAGLLGAAGTVLSALAAHVGGGSTLAVAGSFCLLHAAAILAIGTGAVRSRWLGAAGLLLMAGAAMFSGGVAVHALAGWSAGPLAPIGGTTLVVGWLVVLVGGSGALKRKTPREEP